MSAKMSNYEVMMQAMRIEQGLASFSQVADVILDSIKPKWMGSYLAGMMVQGNWPVDATHGVCVVTNHRSFGNIENQQRYFFSSKEEMDGWLRELNYDCDIAVAVHKFYWDLGPNKDGIDYLN